MNIQFVKNPASVHQIRFLGARAGERQVARFDVEENKGRARLLWSAVAERQRRHRFASDLPWHSALEAFGAFFQLLLT
jgi:hypothetical protein